jgi:hypothetical protein
MRNPRCLSVLSILVAQACADQNPRPDVELVGIAVLPAESFVPGPTSGQFIEPANGVTPPFDGRQPVQGFSAVIRTRRGTLLGLVDNGFGAKENSADFVLRVYELRPDFRTADEGSGDLTIRSAFVLRDPERHIPFPIVADADDYPGSDIPVDVRIRRNRWLTGADFDPESFRQAGDGTFYFGDEFGPFLLHTDSTGRLLEPPIPLPGVRSPQSPLLGDDVPNLPPSGGFEGMALAADGSGLRPLLEKPLVGAEPVLFGYTFDLATGAYLHADAEAATYRYALDELGVAVAEFVRWVGADHLTIERDGAEGPEAKFKRVFRVDLSAVGGAGELAKHEVVDLLDIADPHDLGGAGTGRFSFPFETVESIVVLDDSTVGIVNDNNYPFSVGRHVDTGDPDDTEFILLRVRR